MGLKVYLASSWRNEQQPKVLAALRAAGHEVYDFRNPRPGDKGFGWSSIDPNWQKWTPEGFRGALDHPVARAGFDNDMDALEDAEATVLLLDAGRSAHLEAGFAAGKSQFTVALVEALKEPELMYRMFDVIALDVDEVLKALEDYENAEGVPDGRH